MFNIHDKTRDEFMLDGIFADDTYAPEILYHCLCIKISGA